MRKALVVGAETGELRGVHNDVDIVTTLLTERGFKLDTRIQDNATAAGIRDGWERLIAEASADDVFFIYFSGHGGLAQVNAPNGKPLPDLQFIVPFDYDQSSPSDFRGITSLELSVRLGRLTERSRNVTLFFDCCNAAHMARRGGLRPRALPHPSYLDIAEHIGMLRANGLQVELLPPVDNANAVRLVACAPWESAFEWTNASGTMVGLATDSFRVALTEAGAGRISWRTLAQRIRSRVSAVAENQRPEAEGPARR